MLGEMHVRGRMNDDVSPAFRKTWSATGRTVADDDWKLARSEFMVSGILNVLSGSK